MKRSSLSRALVHICCDQCGSADVFVHFSGGSYCSHKCASAAELHRRDRVKEQTARVDAARCAPRRDRIETGLTGLICLVGILLAVVTLAGCDAPQDHWGPDEERHVRAGHRVAGGGL